MVTIKTIAAKAGVSTSTASRALNDNPRISAKTRRRIKKIAADLGYRPNFSAQNLSRGEANIIGVVFPVSADQETPANPFHTEIMWGISKISHEMNYEIMVALGSTSQELVHQVEAMAQQANVHKFVLLYSQPHDPIVQYLREQHLSFVIVGHPFNPEDRFVDNDNVKVGSAATDLIFTNQNVHHPAFIQSDAHRTFEEDRLVGYHQSLQKHDAEATVISVGPETDLLQQLKQNPQVDSLIFADDVIYLRYARQLKKIELPVMCFNNSQWIKIVFSDQRVIDLQPQALGARAAQLLFNSSRRSMIVPYKID